MSKTILSVALAASTLVILLLAACGGSTGGKTATPAATAPQSALATPTEGAAALATRVAGSRAAKLGPTLLNAADYPPDMPVQQQRAKFVTPRDLPGVASETSGFYATVATASGDEFVTLIVIPFDNDAGASTALGALTTDNYLPQLATGAPDAATSPLDVSGAPLGSKGFGYSGTFSAPGQAGQSIAGQALGFVRGSTYVLLVHGMYAPSARGVDIVKIAVAVDARLAAQGATN
jgi:hypothetical protein